MTDLKPLIPGGNPIASAEQRLLEDRAMRLVADPLVRRARAMAGLLFGRVHLATPAEHMRRFDDAVDEYVFHYAMRAVASDGEYPVIVRFMTPPHHWFGRDVPGSRWAGDSPDFCYRIVTAVHGNRYVLRGRASCPRPPTSHYALMADNSAAPTILSLLDGLDIMMGSDGCFEITIGPEPADGRANHIQTSPGAYQIWVRDALQDWVAQSPNLLSIEKIGAPARDPLSDDELARWMDRSIRDGIYYSYYMTATATVKQPNAIMPVESSGAFGGMASQYSTGAMFQIEDDEALILTTNPAGALFRNAVLTDVFMNSLDYREHTSSLNSEQMAPDEEGTFTYVLARRDPGVHNWLDPVGLRQTLFGHRWQSFAGGAAKEIPAIAGRLVKFADLERELPPGVRRIDAAGRERQIAARREGYDARFREF